MIVGVSFGIIAIGIMLFLWSMSGLNYIYGMNYSEMILSAILMSAGLMGVWEGLYKL